MHLRVETVLDALQTLRGSSGVSIPGTGGRLLFNLSGCKYMFKIMTPHREDLFLVFLPSFPLGNRCAVAPVCAPSSERKGGRKGGREPGKRWLRQWAFSGGRGWCWKRHCSDCICLFAGECAHKGQYLPRSKKIQIVAVFLL